MSLIGIPEASLASSGAGRNGPFFGSMSKEGFRKRKNSPPEWESPDFRPEGPLQALDRWESETVAASKMRADPPPFRDCWRIRWRICFGSAKTVFHVSHGNGRRCALRFAGGSRSDTRRSRHRTLGPGDFVLDSHTIRFARHTPLFRLPNPLLPSRLLPRAVGRPYRLRKPQRLSPNNLHPKQRDFVGARPRCILGRRPHLWKAATNSSSDTIVPGFWALR